MEWKRRRMELKRRRLKLRSKRRRGNFYWYGFKVSNIITKICVES